MKTLKKIMFVAIAIFSLVISSCSSDDSSKDNQDDENTVEFIKFKYNGNAYTFEPGIITSGNINIMGSTGVDNTYKKISLWTPLNVTTGSHPIVFDLSKLETTYQATFSFMPALNNAGATSGTMNITVATDKKIEGTFNFSGTKDGETFTVTEGSFSVVR